MKFPTPLVIPFLAAVTTFASAQPASERSAENSPRTIDTRADELAQFKSDPVGQHPWKRSMPLPDTLQDAGLNPDASLVWTDSYLDGGTKGYLFKDSDGNYLAVCTGPGLQSKDFPNLIDAPVGSCLFIGALRNTDPKAQIVRSGSMCEEMLKALISRAGILRNTGIPAFDFK